MKVLITRSKEQAEEFGERIKKLGFAPIFFPTIQITEPSSWNKADNAIRQIENYTDIIFTSGNGVRYFFQRVKEKRSVDTLKEKIFHTVGDKTKESVESYGFQVARVPEKFDSHSLAKEIVHAVILSEARDIHSSKRHFLFPHGNLTDDTLEAAFKEHNIEIDSVVVYQTTKPTVSETLNKNVWQQLLNSDIEIVVFFSPSGVKHFIETFPNFLQLMNIRIAVIGDTTKKACEETGISNNQIQYIENLFH
jgi:uroporphyrinogen III methyltransferase/synthase